MVLLLLPFALLKLYKLRIECRINYGKKAEMRVEEEEKRCVVRARCSEGQVRREVLKRLPGE